MKTIQILAVSALLLGLTGCEDSNAVFVEHLAIVNINPSHGAVGIGYDTDVTITFSEVLKAGTVSGSTVCLTAESTPPTDPLNPCGTGTPVVASVTYDAPTLTARIVPGVPLNPDERYTLHLTQTIEGEESGTLPAIVRASFSTIPTN